MLTVQLFLWPQKRYGDQKQTDMQKEAMFPIFDLKF